MIIDRVKLIECLELVKPALASTKVVPIMNHFWFTGESLMAYNSQIAIAIPFRSDFEGAVNEGALLGLLKASRAQSLELALEEGHLLLKAPKVKSHLRLPLIPDDQFVFEMPVMPTKGGILPQASQKDFAEGLKFCLKSVSRDASVPDQLGVTVIPDKEGLSLYSTNFTSMMRAQVEMAKPSLKSRVILPRDFVTEIVKWSADHELGLFVEDEYALCKVKRGEEGDVSIFGRLIESDNPLDFAYLIKSNLPKDYEDSLSTIPNKLKLVLDRAAIVCNTSTDEHAATVEAKGGTLFFTSKSMLGEVTDEVTVSGGKQPDLKIKVEPEMLRSACDSFETYLLSEKCVIMERPNVLYLVAAMR